MRSLVTLGLRSEPLVAPERDGHQQAPAPPEIKLAPPEITDEMLDQIAARVADRLSAGAFGETLREVAVATMRETVRSVVTETSERLVREEIERLKSKART